VSSSLLLWFEDNILVSVNFDIYVRACEVTFVITDTLIVFTYLPTYFNSLVYHMTVYLSNLSIP